MKSIKGIIAAVSADQRNDAFSAVINSFGLIMAMIMFSVLLGACKTAPSQTAEAPISDIPLKKKSVTTREVSIISVFDQHVIIGSPFHPYRQGIGYDATRTAAMIQIVPTSDSPAFNKQSLGMVVRKGAALNGGVSPEKMSKAFESLASSGCGDKREFITLPTGSDKVFATVGTCKSLIDKNSKEVALNVYLAGPRDFYIFFWSELVPRGAIVNLNDAIWSDRLRQLMPVHVCAKETATRGMAACIEEYMDLKGAIEKRL